MINWWFRFSMKYCWYLKANHQFFFDSSCRNNFTHLKRKIQTILKFKQKALLICKFKWTIHCLTLLPHDLQVFTLDKYKFSLQTNKILMWFYFCQRHCSLVNYNQTTLVFLGSLVNFNRTAFVLCGSVQLRLKIDSKNVHT